MPRPAKKLTKRDLDNLRRRAEADPGFSSALADASQPGLYAQARRGKVRFMFRYRPPGGGQRRNLQIDWYGAITLEEARKIAGARRAEVAGGIDPATARAEERRRAVTVREAVAAYLADFEVLVAAGTKKPSSLGSARSRLERHVVSKIGDMRVHEVTADHVRRLHRAMKATPGEANRTMTALSAVFGHADRAGLVTGNPVRYVERFTENGRRRALGEEELKRLGDVLHEAETTGGVKVETKTKGGGREKRFHRIHASLTLAVRFLALSGFRAGEVLGHGQTGRRGKREGLRWGDVDLGAGVIHLHDSKTGRQTRVIGAAAVELLRGAKPARAADSDPVCPGAKLGAPLVGTGRPRRYLWKAAGIADSPAGRADLHSLRHSFASIGAHVQNGRYVGLVGPLLGHGYQRRGVTERYITSNPELMRPAADAIAGRIAELLGLGVLGEVIEFPATARSVS